MFIELSDNKLSDNQLSNNLARELVENRSFLKRSQSRKLQFLWSGVFIIIIISSYTQRNNYFTRST